jgi:hypothetical protein
MVGLASWVLGESTRNNVVDHGLRGKLMFEATERRRQLDKPLISSDVLKAGANVDCVDETVRQKQSSGLA